MDFNNIDNKNNNKKKNKNLYLYIAGGIVAVIGIVLAIILPNSKMSGGEIGGETHNISTTGCKTINYTYSGTFVCTNKDVSQKTVLCSEAKTQDYTSYCGRLSMNHIAGSCTKTASSCSACNDGYYLSSGQCFRCPAGSYCSGGKKTTCSAGTYSADGASSCTKCPAGKYCSTTKAENCPGDYTSIEKTATKESDCYIQLKDGEGIETAKGAKTSCPAKSNNTSS